MNNIDQKYIVDINEVFLTEENLLLGNGFTRMLLNLTKTEAEEYKDFTKKVIKDLLKENKKTKTDSRLFLKDIYKKCMKSTKIMYLEEYLYELEKIRYLAKQSYQNDLADEIDKDFRWLREELLKWIKKLNIYSNYKWNDKFKHIFTLNYIPMDGFHEFSKENKYQDFFLGSVQSSKAECDFFKSKYRGAFMKNGLNVGKIAHKKFYYYLHSSINIFYDKQNNTCFSKNKLGDIERPGEETIVLAGTSIEKKAQIKGKDYLEFCLKQLGQITGKLVIFGASLEQNDEHIVQAINQNLQDTKKLTNVYIGFHCTSNDILSKYDLISELLIKFDPEVRTKIKFFNTANVKEMERLFFKNTGSKFVYKKNQSRLAKIFKPIIDLF